MQKVKLVILGYFCWTRGSSVSTPNYLLQFSINDSLVGVGIGCAMFIVDDAVILINQYLMQI